MTSWSSRSSARDRIERLVVDHHLGAALAVVERHERHLAAAARLHAQRRDDAGDQHAVVPCGCSVASDVRTIGASSAGVRGERMARQVEAERHLLLRQALGFASTRASQPVARRRAAAFLAEQRHLRRRRLRARSPASSATPTDASSDDAPRIDRVERAGADQRLDDAPVDDALVDAAAEVEQVGERAARLARRDDRLDRGLAGALDRAQAVADAASRRPARSGSRDALTSGGSDRRGRCAIASS